jgi:hypothetical protein
MPEDFNSGRTFLHAKYALGLCQSWFLDRTQSVSRGQGMEGYLTDVRLPKRAETLPYFLQPGMALSILTRPMVLLENGSGERLGSFVEGNRAQWLSKWIHLPDEPRGEHVRQASTVLRRTGRQGLVAR